MTKDRSGCTATTLLLYFAFALVHDSRGIEMVNFTISLALSSGTLTASAGTPYRLVPAHFYPCSPLDSWGKGIFSFYMYISSSMPVSTPRVKKTRHQSLGHNFTNYYPIFKIFFTSRLSSKFATKTNSCLDIPPRLKHVATLPCEIWMQKNGIILKYVLQLMMNHKVV